MSAADRREELHAAIRAQIAIIRENAIRETATYLGTRLSIPLLAQELTVPGTRQAARAIYDAADDLARAAVDEAIGPYRLAAARAEHSPATMPGARP